MATVSQACNENGEHENIITIDMRSYKPLPLHRGVFHSCEKYQNSYSVLKKEVISDIPQMHTFKVYRK